MEVTINLKGIATKARKMAQERGVTVEALCVDLIRERMAQGRAGRPAGDLPMEAIDAAALAGESVRSLAAKYHVGRDTISRRLIAWRAQASR